MILTTPGRVIFNEEVQRALGESIGDANGDVPFMNKPLTKREMDDFIIGLVQEYGAPGSRACSTR